ncbi:hypothetical protein IU487_35945 [Nocardia puris]|uniref:hypothetical protein n=1 Tax=Nocardia puris TaxID=208602 RepID=UPI00189596DB|nr:hypothetical protein [Nocardia puris]MBF6216382.1 hypothetical protein [Nocardia puris]
MGLSDLYADPSEVADDVYTVADDETMVLATPHWSVVLARPQEVEDTGGAPRPDRALLLVGHGKGWPQWTRTEESLVRFLDRQRRASVSHGWIRLTRDGS